MKLLWFSRFSPYFLQLVPEGNIVKFFGSVDMDKILLKKDGVIEGFYDVPLSITGA